VCKKLLLTNIFRYLERLHKQSCYTANWDKCWGSVDTVSKPCSRKQI